MRRRGAAVAWDRSDDPAEGGVQDAVPPEWTRKLELDAAAEAAAKRAERQHRIAVIWTVIPVIVVIAVLATLGVLSVSPPAGPVVLPSTIQAFATPLPESQQPNSAGVAVVDGNDAPDTWRVEWVTQDAAVCFAFVHQSEPAQTSCDAPGSAESANMRIIGELSESGLNPPEIFTCGFTDGGEGFAEIDDGTVVGPLIDIGSGLSGYCLQLPEGTAAGASFTVSTSILVGTGKNARNVDVTATYP